MPSWPVLKVLVKELVTNSQIPRQTEPTLVMDDPQQVREYTLAGLEGGVMAPVYLFHSTQVSEFMHPRSRVLDLACGPANQLAQIARLNPDCHFTGIDLSAEMLDRARALIQSQKLDNIDLVLGSITDLGRFEDGSFDCVFSTMALHHLPDTDALRATLREVARVLKADGRLYLVDFGRLRRDDSMSYFAYQYEGRQPPLFTTDYLNSLRAAFSLTDFRSAALEALGDRAKVVSTCCVPYMVAVISRTPRRSLPEVTRNAIHRLRDALPAYHQTDLSDLRTFFRLGGLPSPSLD